MAEKTAAQVMEESMQAIEKGLEDIQKNKASKAEVLKLIDERKSLDAEAVKAAEAKLDEAVDEVEILKTESDTMKKQLRTMKANGYGSLKDSQGNYRGLYRSPEEAKAVGLMMMAASMHAGIDNSAVKAKRDAVLKALDSMATEVKWLDDEGNRIQAATTSSQGSGAVFATTEQAPGLIMLLEQYGKFRSNAMNVPLGATTTLMPKIDSLLTVYVPGETNVPSMTDVLAGMLSLTPKTMMALTAYSMELDEDSAIGLAELYGMLFARSLAYYEDLCGFLGDGTSTYFGFTGICGALRAVDATIGNIKSLVVASGNAYSEITLVDFEKLIGTLPEFADNEDAKHYCHKYFYYTVMIKLALAAGGVTATEIITGAGKREKSFLSYNVDFSQVMPKVAANSQICDIFGNLRMGAMLGTRGGMEFAQSDQRFFDQGMIALRVRSRVHINAHGVGDTSKAGPLCALITAAS